MDRELSVYELAIVNGGPPLAVRAALAKLLRSGAIKRTGTGIVTVAAMPPADPFEAEVLTAAADHPRRGTLMRRLRRGAWMRATVKRLIADGLMVSRISRRTQIVRMAIPAVVLFGAGIISTASGNSVIGLLLVIVGVIGCIGALRSGLGGPRATPAGTAALQTRREAQDADPEAADAEREADPSVRIALFGMRDLELTDPRLAAEVGIPFSDSAPTVD